MPLVQVTDPTILKGWLPLADAAVAYGLSERTIRRRLPLGQIDYGYLGKDLRIKPPGEQTATPESAPTGTPSTDLIRIADVDRLLAPILTERDALAAKVEELHEARRADAEEIGRLRGRLEALAAATPPPRRRWPWQR